MKKLELYYPAKPYIVAQKFGIYNPAYLQFGFSKHNGEDFAVDKDGVVLAMCDGVVTETGFNSGAGNFVKYKTNEKVDVDGVPRTVGFMYMHGERILVKQWDLVKAGTPLMIADNTGFSTGPHTHISAYFLNELGNKIVLDPASNDCFDFSKFYNGFHADDAKFVESIRHVPLMVQLFALMKKIIS